MATSPNPTEARERQDLSLDDLLAAHIGRLRRGRRRGPLAHIATDSTDERSVQDAFEQISNQFDFDRHARQLRRRNGRRRLIKTV